MPQHAPSPHTPATAPPAPSVATPPAPSDATGPVVLDRRDGPYGEVVLRRHGEVVQIIANGCFLMDTSDGRSERLLVRAALAALDDRPRPSLLLGGLGVGFSLAEAAAEPRWGRITVVEREPAIIAWHRGDPDAPGGDAGRGAAHGPLARISAAALADPRTEVVQADLTTLLRAPGDRYDALCLDVDNGPDWTVTEDNRGLYTPEGLAACRDRLTPGGVLAVWSARPSPAFEDALRRAGFTAVRTEEVSVARGAPDVVHLASRPA